MRLNRIHLSVFTGGVKQYSLFRKRLIAVVLIPLSLYFFARDLDTFNDLYEISFDFHLKQNNPNNNCLTEYYAPNTPDPTSPPCCNIASFPNITSDFLSVEDMFASRKESQCLLDEALKYVDVEALTSKNEFDFYLKAMQLCGSGLQLTLFIVSVLPCVKVALSQRIVILAWFMKLLVAIIVCFIPWSYRTSPIFVFLILQQQFILHSHTLSHSLSHTPHTYIRLSLSILLSCRL